MEFTSPYLNYLECHSSNHRWYTENRMEKKDHRKVLALL